MKGTATISLDDLDALRKSAEEGKRALEVVMDVQEALDVILNITSDPSRIADAYNAKQYSTALRLKDTGWRLERRK